MGATKSLAAMINDKEKQLINTVTRLLEENIDYRDNPYALMANVWYEDIGSEETNHISCFVFLTRFAEKQVTPPERILEVMLMVQQDNEQLRGETYELTINKKRTAGVPKSRSGKKRMVRANDESNEANSDTESET